MRQPLDAVNGDLPRICPPDNRDDALFGGLRILARLDPRQLERAAARQSIRQRTVQPIQLQQLRAELPRVPFQRPGPRLHPHLDLLVRVPWPASARRDRRRRCAGGPGGLEHDPAIIHEQPVAAHRDPLRHAAVAGQDHALRIDAEVVAAFDVAVDVVGMGIAGQQRRREEAQGATHAHLHRSGSVGRSTPLSRTRSIRARSTCLWTGPSCSSRWRASSDRPPVIACAAVGFRGESVTDGGAHEATSPSAVGLRHGWRGDGNRKRPLAAHSKH